MAQRGLAAARPSQLEEALTGPVSMQMVLGDKSLGLQDADGGPAGRSSLDTHQETQHDSKRLGSRRVECLGVSNHEMKSLNEPEIMNHALKVQCVTFWLGLCFFYW